MPPLQNKQQLTREDPQSRLADVFSQYHPVADKSAQDISRSYLKKVSTGLVFNDDVLLDRAPHMLPYNEDDLHAVFRNGDLFQAKASAVGLGGRHDPRGVVKRHTLCHLKGPRKLKPLRRSKTTPSRADTEKHITVPTCRAKAVHSSTDTASSKDVAKHEWDEYVLACLSQSTAKWIINEQSSGSDKERLNSFLEKRIKATDVGVSENVPQETKHSSSIKKVKEPRDKKSQQTLEIHYTPSFTLSTAVGNKKLETDNIFQQELLGGAQPVPSKKSLESSFIVLDTNDELKFEKQLQENYPQGSKIWYRGPSGKTEAKPQKKPKKLVRGLQRWKDLPVVVQVLYMYMQKAKLNIYCICYYMYICTSC